ncbi:ELL-associated factor 1-like [Penaeus monodon]|uniref:ELL-associated factor 1-like n=1 Tax=Penaeus monodon TaxID=6687 RepID=UPI0018A75190|nr:ELL-associated factor 1-like [Penaeus monodon]
MNLSSRESAPKKMHSCLTMADKLGVDGKVKDMELGDTFSKNYKEGAFHTLRYDFKPASVDNQKMGTVEVEGNHQVTVTVPHVEGAGTAQTVFKGNHKPVAKECILIIDHTTGEIVLERISQAIIVKTTRPEGSSRLPTQRPPTPLDPSRKSSPPQKCSPSHPPSRGSSNSLPYSRPSPSHAKLSPPSKSSPHTRSPIPSKSPNNNHCTAPGSMPMLGFDDNIPENKTGSMMSDSSSDSDSNSSTSSSSDSDSDSEPEQDTRGKKANGHGAGGGTIPNGSNCLMNDLELSSVSEDSD